jgi:hypothetical protein
MDSESAILTFISSKSTAACFSWNSAAKRQELKLFAECRLNGDDCTVKYNAVIVIHDKSGDEKL